MDLLLGPLAALGYCQPDGTFITTLAELQQRLGEMAASGEAVCVDGLATRVQRPREWVNQKGLYDAKRRAHTAQGLAISTIHSDLLWRDGAGRPAATSRSSSPCQGSVGCWTPAASPPSWTGGFGAWPSRASTGMPPWGPAHQGPADRRAAGVQPRAGGAARAGGAGDRLSGRRVGVAPLARAAVPGPGRLAGRCRAPLPLPLASPDSQMRGHPGHLHQAAPANHSHRATPRSVQPSGQDALSVVDRSGPHAPASCGTRTVWRRSRPSCQAIGSPRVRPLRGSTRRQSQPATPRCLCLATHRQRRTARPVAVATPSAPCPRSRRHRPRRAGAAPVDLAPGPPGRRQGGRGWWLCDRRRTAHQSARTHRGGRCLPSRRGQAGMGTAAPLGRRRCAGAG
jgi:hypothetical protein